MCQNHKGVIDAKKEIETKNKPMKNNLKDQLQKCWNLREKQRGSDFFF